MDRNEELELIERYYRKTVGWVPSDEEALAIAQDLLEKAQRGFVVDDTGEGLLYASDPELPVDAEFLVDEGALNRERLRRGLAIVAACLIALLALFLVYGGDAIPTPTETPAAATEVPLFLATQTLTPTPTSSPIPTAVPTYTPTSSPIPTAVPTYTPTPTRVPTQTPTSLPPEEVKVKPQPVKLEEGAVVPVSLEIAGRYFPVVPTGLRDDHWAYLTEADQVSWLAGSHVNVLLGLAYTQQNLDLVASSLTISDTLTLRNSVGGINRYRVVDRRSVDVYVIEVLGQRRAGLTLVLLGGNAEAPTGGPDRRLVVWAIPVDIREEVATTQEN